MTFKHRFLPWVLLAFFLFALSRAPGQTTAWQALDSVKAQRGAMALGRVTQIRGQNGQDQPAAWEIVTQAADGERVYVVQGGRIVADTIYSSGAGVPVDMRRLRVDSGEAFTIANRVAAESKVGFDAIDYELNTSTTGNAPIWVMYLRDEQGRDVGEVEVSGENGSVLRRSWFQPRVANREPIGPEPSGRHATRSYDGSGAPVSGGLMRRPGIEGAAEKIKDGFQSIGSGFGKIFRGEATYEVRDVERSSTPKTLRRSRP